VKRIALSQGKFALVDNEDYSALTQFKWCVANGEVVTNQPGKNGHLLYMKRVLLRATTGDIVSFKSQNHLDLRKRNLVLKKRKAKA
jgi:hypothetical protein